MYGVQTVIAYDTHQILDIEVLSKSCVSWKACERNGSITAHQYDEWRAQHADSCTINTAASTPAMEAEAAVKLWERSEEHCGLKYTCYIGDGDSKGFKMVTEADPYPGTQIQKDECIGHVQKRIGKGLRELKKMGSDKLDDGKPLCGKGRLALDYMNRLQNY